MPDLLNDYLQFHQRALSVRAERQEILASNIANADTPHFKARDIDFKAALTTALSASLSATSATALNNTHVTHLDKKSTAGSSELLYRIPRQDSIDGNTVELDTERAQFADNALRYEAGISAVNGKIKSLLSVIQGQ